MALRKGFGYQTSVGGLLLKTEVQDEGWQYQILSIKDKKIVRDWTIPPHQSTTNYQEPENSKFEALSFALMVLGRTKEDHHDTFRKTAWTEYGTGRP